MEIQTNRLILLELAMDDVQAVHHLHSIPEVDEFNTLGIPKDLEETENLVQSSIDAGMKEPRSAYHWKIILKESNEMIGLAGFFLSLDKFKLGEIYYKFHPAHWRKGYATEVSKALINAGFKEFKLHKVEAGVAVGNDASMRVLEKCGMTREGLRRKILPIRGQWVDNYHFAIVEDDPREY